MDRAKRVSPEVDYDLVYNFVSSQLAKGEAKSLLCNRILTSKHATRRAPTTGGPQLKHSINHASNLVACLPQGNRCIRPPREAFITLAKAAQRKEDKPVDVIHNAFLLEEYTIQLLQEHEGVPQNDQCETVSPWALGCSGVQSRQLHLRELKVLTSKRNASQLNSALNQLKVLCGAQTGGVAATDHGDEEQKHEIHSAGVIGSSAMALTNRRRRKRKRYAHATSETMAEARDEGVVEVYKRAKRSAPSEEDWSSDSYGSVTCSEHSTEPDGSPVVEREDIVVQ